MVRTAYAETRGRMSDALPANADPPHGQVYAWGALTAEGLMKILTGIQAAQISDAVMAKFAMVVPVLEASLYSLAIDRVARLEGYGKITLYDLAREMREGDGDAGICLEYAVHEGIAQKSDLIYPLASEALERFCGIKGGASSILFGPEKDGRIPILETVNRSLTDDSLVYLGDRGRPPKLKRHIPEIINSFRRPDARNGLPRSIRDLYKADIFIGNGATEQWVGTTIKSHRSLLEGAQGLRIGMYPRETTNDDEPRFDDKLNLILLPLPYDMGFSELFYATFFLVRAFFKADAHVPAPVSLPMAEDQFVTRELEKRREFPILDVIQVIREMSQRDLLTTEPVRDLKPELYLSENDGLVRTEVIAPTSASSIVSVAIMPSASDFIWTMPDQEASSETGADLLRSFRTDNPKEIVLLDRPHPATQVGASLVAIERNMDAVKGTCCGRSKKVARMLTREEHDVLLRMGARPVTVAEFDAYGQ